MATYYKVDNTIENVKPKNEKHFTYEELQDFVGEGEERYIEVIPLPSTNRSMVLNENGKLIGLRLNSRATDVFKAEYPIEKYPYNNDELIVGNVLVVDNNELEN